VDAAEPIKSDPQLALAGLDFGAPDDEALLDAQALVDQMAAAGDWPDPKLLEQILETGDDAVEPLFAIVRTIRDEQYDPGPVSHAIGLLSILRPPAAIAELVAVIQQHPEDVLPDAAYGLSKFGAPGFDALLDLCRDPSVTAVERSEMYGAAREAAGDDPVLKSRLADFMRTSLQERIAQAREERALNPPDEEADLEIDERSVLFGLHNDGDGPDNASFGEDSIDEDELLDDDESDLDDELFHEERDPDVDEELLDESIESDDEDDVFDDDDDDDILFTTDEEIGFLIADLACLADPLSADLIETAFREKLVSRKIVSKGFVEKKYQSGGESRRGDLREDWLGEYRFEYEAYVETLDPPSRPRPVGAPRYEDDEGDFDDEAEFQSVTPTIRNTGPKLGRNDPCWCGSGKKYKKCHHGKDAPG